MKTLLVSCRSPFLDDSKVYPPLGIMKLQAALNQWTDQEVHITDDYNLEYPHRFVGYDLIGLSVMTPQREEALNIYNTVRGLNPNAKIVIGGPHAKHY